MNPYTLTFIFLCFLLGFSMSSQAHEYINNGELSCYAQQCPTGHGGTNDNRTDSPAATCELCRPGYNAYYDGPGGSLDGCGFTGVTSIMYCGNWDLCTQPEYPEGYAFHVHKQRCDPVTDGPIDDEDCQNEFGPDYRILHTQIGNSHHYECVIPLADPSNPDCSDRAGTIDFNGETTVICNDEKNACEADGGAWGQWGLGAGEVGCVSPDVADDLPTCEVWTINAATGAFGCVTDISDIPETPNTDDPEPTDTDGDGTPDKDDGDLDGDGINNDVDPDIDGDGIPNDGDPTPFGEFEQTEERTDGGVNCDLAPSCTGNAIQCAQLYQLWAIRCPTDESESKLTGDDQCVTEPTCEGKPFECAALLQNWRHSCFLNQPDDTADQLSDISLGDLDQGDTDVSTLLGDVFSQPETTSACPSPQTITVAGASLTIPYQPICDVASAIRPVVILFFSFLGFRVVMGAF